MILLEYEAKSILHSYNIPVPSGTVAPAHTTPNIPLPTVIKSQVPTGRRGKRGGIKLAKTQEELEENSKTISNLEIKGFTPRTLLFEDALAIQKELYLSLRIDRSSESIELMAHTNGGVEVEENAADSFFTLHLTTCPTLAQGQELADFYALESHTFTLQEIVTNLYTCFVKEDATLIEINPLILTAEDELVAGDCKMTLDDAAYFRHPHWNFETAPEESNFVTLNPEGNIATIANGAGLAMATVDAVAAATLTPANFLDIGGGASAESVLEAFTTILKYKNVKAIIINIFAGITRCDEIAKAIITAKEKLPNLPPLAIRLAGNNYEEAHQLLAEKNIQLLPTLQDCIETAKEYV